MNKIEEAQTILRDLGLPVQQQNKLSALTLLALAGLKETDQWSSASDKRLTLSKDIIEFVNQHYNQNYKPNTRESFRKNALKPFVEKNIAILNPDDLNLSPTSSKTHYALSELALKVLRQFGKETWSEAVLEFKRNQFPENEPSTLQVKKIIIYNYKSIIEDTIDLGRFNVFIGVNGCGKSNILESLAILSAAKTNDLNFEGLYSRGVRLARPDLLTSSFLNTQKKESIEVEVNVQDNDENQSLFCSIYPDNPNDIYTKWFDGALKDVLPEERFNLLYQEILQDVLKKFPDVNTNSLYERVEKRVGERGFKIEKDKYLKLLSEYCIYDLNTKTLRGITPVDSRKTPLGINGEGLDLLIATFNSYEKDFLDSKTKTFFSWLEKIQNEKDEKNKAEGLKAGRSTSTLYFTDKFMQRQNNVLSAENSNEGILHVIFYLALFISTKTPKLFAIDNIETALNPRLCQILISLLVQLSKERGKQVLITTHNPAVLDGLNLLDDDQRLFVVYRNDEGHTKTRRIKFKKNLEDKKFKLSEMWLKGSLGAVLENF
jgi:AAA15 family ATPase/GTPase